jgi:hypothetical protein
MASVRATVLDTPLPAGRTVAVCIVVALWARTLPLAADLGPIGLTTEGAQRFEHSDPASSDPDRNFGWSLAAGDFNGDGADDLATGVPDERTVPTRRGAVVVRYGRRSGGLVGGAGTVLRHEAGTGVAGAHFGEALAAGDFDGDGFDDLAVGIPGDGNVPIDGSVRVYYGGEDGLATAGYETLDEVVGGAGTHYCSGGAAQFGIRLAVGNFDADAFDDLAIGAIHACERVSPNSWMTGGAVFVAHGKSDGLLPFFGYRISQDSFGIGDQVEGQDKFGGALAAGDFNGDGFDDLGIGIPGENENSGAVEILMGSQWGLLFANSAFWLPGALGEVPEVEDQLGFALTSGDFDGDGFDDLAVGAPFEDMDTDESVGAVDVAYGAPDPWWFDLSRTDLLTQSSIYGNAAHDGPGDAFGYSLAAGDFDGDGRDDLAIGHPFDDWPGDNLGAVTILMGDVPPLGSATRHHLLAIGWEGVPGDASQVPQWGGLALGVGDFDGSGRPDLCIGAPGWDAPSLPIAGAEVVLYGETKLFSDGFETGDTSRWSAVY